VPYFPDNRPLPKVEKGYYLSTTKMQLINYFFSNPKLNINVCCHPKWLYDFMMSCRPLTEKQLLLNEIRKEIKKTVEVAAGKGNLWGRCLQAIRPGGEMPVEDIKYKTMFH
jgi:hypothetical protein